MTTPETERIRRAYDARAAAGADERYALTSPANLYLYQRRERDLLDALRRNGLLPLDGKRVLDVGCGSGGVLRDFVRYGARPEGCAGVDLLPERIASARAASPAGMTFDAGSADTLPYGDASFDIALQFTLLSSVLDSAMRQRIAAETLRVLRPGGAAVWYDFTWNPGNRDTRGIGMRELRALYAGCRIDARRVTLAPPMTRRVARYSFTVCRALEAMPFLRSHLLAVIRRA